MKKFQVFGIILALAMVVFAVIGAVMMGFRTESVWTGLVTGGACLLGVGAFFVGTLVYNNGADERGISKVMYTITAIGAWVLAISAIIRTVPLLANWTVVNEVIETPTNWSLAIGGILFVGPLVLAALYGFIKALPDMVAALIRTIADHYIITALALGFGLAVGIFYEWAAGIGFAVCFVLECVFFTCWNKIDNEDAKVPLRMILAALIVFLAGPMLSILVEMFGLQETIIGEVPAYLAYTAAGIFGLLFAGLLIYGLVCGWKKSVDWARKR